MFHSTPTLPKGDHPFKYQSTILRQDEYALDLLSLKYSGVADSTASQLATHPSPTASPSVNTLSVLNAAAHARNEVGKPALKAILPLLEKRPNDIGLLLTIVQLYVLTNQTATATSLLESFFKKLDESSSPSNQDVRFAPGLIGTTVSLYEKQGRKPHAKAALAAAAAYWRSKHKPESKGPPASVSLLKAAGSSLLDSSNAEDAKTASEIFSDLHKRDPEDRASTAGLVASLAMSKAGKIDDSLLDALTPAARLVSGIDAAALEEAGVARPPEAVEAESKKRAAPAHDANKAKRKKLLKSRTPQDFVEGKEMDPERWLPVRDRSYWKPKGKKGKSRAAGLTQGGAVDEKSTEVVKSAGVVGDKSKKKKKGKR
jgi:signal recognition particle subunit SRP72